MARNGKLTPKRQRFVEAYLSSGNGTQAAIAAGYRRKAAKAIASELLTFPDIQAAIQARQHDAAQRAGVSHERIMRELARLAFTRIDEIATWEGEEVTIKDSSALTRINWPRSSRSSGRLADRGPRSG
jgi:phage terminase small subunit